MHTHILEYEHSFFLRGSDEKGGDNRFSLKITFPSFNILVLLVNSIIVSDFEVLLLDQFYQQVAETTTLDTIHCLCSHLTAFGGQLFVAPNPIDFDKVFIEFDRLPETGNVAVMIAVCCVFGLYLLLLVWARKADLQDALKVGILSDIEMSVFVSFTGLNVSSSEYKRDIQFYKHIHS